MLSNAIQFRMNQDDGQISVKDGVLPWIEKEETMDDEHWLCSSTYTPSTGNSIRIEIERYLIERQWSSSIPRPV